MKLQFQKELWADTIRLWFKRQGIPLTRNDRKLRALKNKYAGVRGFVIGNGPSLSQTDLERIKNEVTIACNGIFLLFPETSFRPMFYTVEDQLVAEDRATAINQLRGFIKIIPADLRRWLQSDEDTIFINFVRDYPEFPRFGSELEEYCYWGGTVTFLSLQIAFYLGIREVYLIGIDHYYSPPAREDAVAGTVITSQTFDINHFHPDYFGPGYRWHDPKVDRMEIAYRKAREFFESHGGIIYNATVGGRLEVFPRVNYEEITRSSIFDNVSGR